MPPCRLAAMPRRITEALGLDPAIEIGRYAAFDYPTRRFIAYSIGHIPEIASYRIERPGIADNSVTPFAVSDAETVERAAAYAMLPRVRAANALGASVQRERRLAFGDVLGMAIVDLRWKRLTAIAPFLFCYERLAGPHWRELLPLCWREATLQRRKRKGAVQLPLDSRLREDASVPRLLERDPPPRFYPSLADAEQIESPLLAGL
jgi:hypothetical protein